MICFLGNSYILRKQINMVQYLFVYYVSYTFVYLWTVSKEWGICTFLHRKDWIKEINLFDFPNFPPGKLTNPLRDNFLLTVYIYRCW